MSNFYDELERRTPSQREEENFNKLRETLGIAKAKSKYFSKLLDRIDVNSIKDRTDLSKLPIIRKDDLQESQTIALPFG